MKKYSAQWTIGSNVDLSDNIYETDLLSIFYMLGTVLSPRMISILDVFEMPWNIQVQNV